MSSSPVPFNTSSPLVPNLPPRGGLFGPGAELSMADVSLRFMCRCLALPHPPMEVDGNECQGAMLVGGPDISVAHSVCRRLERAGSRGVIGERRDPITHCDLAHTLRRASDFLAKRVPARCRKIVEAGKRGRGANRLLQRVCARFQTVCRVIPDGVLGFASCKSVALRNVRRFWAGPPKRFANVEPSRFTQAERSHLNVSSRRVTPGRRPTGVSRLAVR